MKERGNPAVDSKITYRIYQALLDEHNRHTQNTIENVDSSTFSTTYISFPKFKSKAEKKPPQSPELTLSDDTKYATEPLTLKEEEGYARFPSYLEPQVNDAQKSVYVFLLLKNFCTFAPADLSEKPTLTQKSMINSPSQRV